MVLLQKPLFGNFVFKSVMQNRPYVSKDPLKFKTPEHGHSDEPRQIQENIQD